MAKPDEAPKKPKSDTKPEPQGGESGGDALDWRHVHLWQIQPVRDVLVVLAIVGIFYLGYVLRVVTVPILLALMLAYLFEPVVSRLCRVKWISRPGGASIIIAAVVLVVLIPVTLGVGYGAVQGVGAARNLSRISGNMLTVVDRIDIEPVVFDDEGEFTGFSPILDSDAGTGTAAEDGARLDAARANEAYEALPGLLKQVVRYYAASVEAEQATGAAIDALRNDDEAPAPAEDAPADEEVAGAGVDESGGGGGAKELPPSRAAQPRIISVIFGWLEANASAIAGRAFGTGVDAATAVVRTFTSIFMLGFALFLTGFFFFFFSSAYPGVLEFGKKLIPGTKKDRALELITKFDGVVAGFVRGRLTIAFVLSVLFTVAYWIIGVPAPLVLGPIIGILSVVPYLSLIGIPLTIIGLALEQHTGVYGQWWWIVGAPIAVYMIVQSLDDYVLTPMIQGKTTDMDTPSIVFASIAGGVLFGFYGVLIAIPVAACLKIVIREILWPQFKEWSEGRSKDFLPLGRE